MPASSSNQIAQLIAEALRLPESESRLDVLALLIARLEYPELDTEAYLRRLDELAARVAAGAELDGAPPLSVISVLNRCLFDEEKFQGNVDGYYDPRNSFLNDVLDRRTGIPITVSMVYMEVARRLGHRFRGIGMTGHFLVRGPGPAGIIVDPFHRGRILTEADCEERLREIYGPPTRLEPAFLKPVGNKYIVTRMLGNLRTIYRNSRMYRKELNIVSVLLEIYPRAAEDYKQRAALHQALGNSSRASADFEKYLEMAPEAGDADEVRQTIIALKRLLASSN